MSNDCEQEQAFMQSLFPRQEIKSLDPIREPTPEEITARTEQRNQLAELNRTGRIVSESRTSDRYPDLDTAALGRFFRGEPEPEPETPPQPAPEPSTLKENTTDDWNN